MGGKRDKINLTTDDPNKSVGEVLAGEVLKGHLNAAMLLDNLLRGSYGESTEVNDWMSSLEQTTKAVKSGNLSSIEGVLVGQAYALDALFLHLIRLSQDTNLMPQLETFTRLALKAQSQSRATAQTLAAIKNPQQAVFMKQANIAHGPQQVNNGPIGDVQEAPTEAQKKNNFVKNKLLEADEKGNRLDFGTQGETGQSDQTMGTVETVNRAKNNKRKGKSVSKRL